MSGSLVDTAIKLLADYNCSEQDLRKRLEREFSDLEDRETQIDATLIRMHDLHLLNDKGLADSLARRYQHKGNRFITGVLRNKGLEDELISDVVASLEEEYTRALDVALRKGAPKIRQATPDKAQARVYRLLANGGFSFETIDAVLKHLQDERFFVVPD